MNEAGGKYRRDLGSLGILLIVINGLIGAGIFGLPEVLHGAVGAFAPWLLLIGGLLVASIVICFAELARLTERSGGPQRFVGDAFGAFAGFQVGWTFFSARVISQGANVLVLVAYAAALWPSLGEGSSRIALAVAVLGALTVINVLGFRSLIAVLGGMTFLKLAPLLILVAVGLASMGPIGPVVLPEFSAVEGVALGALYAFVGFENATVPAGEARNPKQDMPRALLLGLAVVTLLYFAIQLVYSHSPIAGTGADAPLVELARLYGGELGALLIAATIVVSVLANLTAGHASASRMPPALADDGLLPSWFGAVSRWGTPANSITFFGAVAIVIALNDDFLALAIVSTLARLIAYISSILALPRLRKARGLPPFNRTILVAAPVALVLSFWAIMQTGLDQWRVIAIFLAAGTALYFLARRGRGKTA